MMSIDQVVACLTATRRDFSDLLLRAQIEAGIPMPDRVEFEAIAPLADDKEAFRKALKYCKGKRSLFEEMVRQIIRNGMDGGALSATTPEHEIAIQAIVNPAQGLTQAGNLTQMETNGRNWTGKVLIDGVAMGSGVLIGPRRFLTAWHVVENMFYQDNSSGTLQYRPKDQAPLLEVMFDDYPCITGSTRRAARPRKVLAAPDWNEGFCPCHEEELQQALPVPNTALAGYWDYAILKLEHRLDMERRWAKLENKAVVPGAQSLIFVYQYPNGTDLRYDVGHIVSPEQPNPAIPGIRFLHHSNALNGSSGGPCFDTESNLIGIHQGAWPEQVGGRTTNRGIPIRSIIADMVQQNVKIDSLDITEAEDRADLLVWYTDKRDYNPVIGMEQFQMLVYENIRSSKGHILLIKGDEGTGKTYCIDVLFALLNNSDHLKIRFPADIIAQYDVMAFAMMICAMAGAELRDVTPVSAYNTTSAAWLKDELVPKVISALDNKRNGRMVWICISNLNKCRINNKNTSDFLLLLYESVHQNAWLQFILDGAGNDLPVSLSEPIQICTMQPKSKEEIHHYFKFFMQELKITAHDLMFNAFAATLHDIYLDQLSRDPSKAMSMLTKQCKLMTQQLLQQLAL